MPDSSYTSPDREAIWIALFNLLKNDKTLAGMLTSLGRRPVLPPDLTQAMQPALFIAQIGESHNTKTPTPIQRPSGLPPALTLDGSLLIYAYQTAINQPVGKETDLAVTVLNKILKALDDALAPPIAGNGYQTLGGAAKHCWIEGVTTMDPGLTSQQAFAVVPLYILVP